MADSKIQTLTLSELEQRQIETALAEPAEVNDNLVKLLSSMRTGFDTPAEVHSTHPEETEIHAVKRLLRDAVRLKEYDGTWINADALRDTLEDSDD